jgi:hypothetical protein
VRWQYKVANAPTTPRELQQVLDHDGAEEWELVSTTPIATRLLLLFKRPLEYTQQAEYTPEAEVVEEQAPETMDTMDTHTKQIVLPESEVTENDELMDAESFPNR